MEQRILLGHVIIKVGHIINTWESEVKKRFLNPHKTDKDKQIIAKHEKSDWFCEYMIKKYEKMDLITREGIFKPRILDYAEVILKVVNRLKKITRLQSVLNANIVRNYVKMEFRNAKIPTSLVGEELTNAIVTGKPCNLFESVYYF